MRGKHNKKKKLFLIIILVSILLYFIFSEIEFVSVPAKVEFEEAYNIDFYKEAIDGDDIMASCYATVAGDVSLCDNLEIDEIEGCKDKIGVDNAVIIAYYQLTKGECESEDAFCRAVKSNNCGDLEADDHRRACLCITKQECEYVNVHVPPLMNKTLKNVREYIEKNMSQAGIKLTEEEIDDYVKFFDVEGLTMFVRSFGNYSSLRALAKYQFCCEPLHKHFNLFKEKAIEEACYEFNLEGFPKAIIRKRACLGLITGECKDEVGVLATDMARLEYIKTFNVIEQCDLIVDRDLKPICRDQKKTYKDVLDIIYGRTGNFTFLSERRKQKILKEYEERGEQRHIEWE